MAAAVGGVAATTPTATTSASKDIFGGLGPDAFLKLLVAQLRYQNPMNPSDPTAMMAQIAQYAQVEALTKLQQGQAVDQSLSEARLATDMVGKFVTASDGTITESGKVLSARFTPTGPVLVLDSGSEVTLSAVTRVDQLTEPEASPATTPAATPAAPAAQTGSTTTFATTAAVAQPAAADPIPPVVPVVPVVPAVPAVVDPLVVDPATASSAAPSTITTTVTTPDSPTN